MLPQHTDRQLGNYTLLHLLGRSNFSEVYLAEHIHSRAQVAIKLLSGRRTGYDMEQFLAQAALLTRLSHPHIVPVLDFGVEDGTAFLVMSYTPYGTLRLRHPKGTRVPFESIISYIKQIAEALEHVHQHQLVHRDVKPHNMLLGANSEVVLSDFGIAVVSHSLTPDQPYVHDFEGTVLYAAPEQFQGKPRRSSDQYALGIVVYEWISGTWPFSGSFDEIVRQHMFVAPPPLHEKGIECPASIEQVVLRALEKDPARRYQSVRQFADELLWSYTIAAASGALPTAQARHQFKSPLPFG